ncbi:dTDP-4-dehydrorhamnose reductase [Devosia sp.]|uniref:dTDP-4-dehydrorhamnose reductase n=1 Tax=Devosia sp. TaxID=1871048 RepID=UPI0035AE8692
MKLVIFGRDGQVGTALLAALAPLGEVVAYGRAGADFEEPGAAAALVRRERPDLVVNAAAYTAVDRAEVEPDRARRINAVTPGEVARAAAEIGARMIHYSTDYVFDGEKSAPYVETDATAPLNVYGTSKRDGEIAVLAEGGHFVLRTSWVHAPGGSNFIAKILNLAQSRDELKVIDDQIGAPTSARLIAETTAALIRRLAGDRPPAGGIYHLTAAGETSWNGYARFIIAAAAAAGVALRARPETVLPVPSSAFPTPARRPRNSRLSTGKLRDALGIDLPDWRDDVASTLKTLLPEPTP